MIVTKTYCDGCGREMKSGDRLSPIDMEDWERNPRKYGACKDCRTKIQDMLRLQKVEEAGEANELNKRNTPLEAEQVQLHGANIGYRCPICGGRAIPKENYFCSFCGQRLKWDKYKELVKFYGFKE